MIAYSPETVTSAPSFMHEMIGWMSIRGLSKGSEAERKNLRRVRPFGGFGSLSPDTINDAGDAAVGFNLNPPTLPVGVNAGVYRFDHASHQVTDVLVPGVTPAPGGGTFQAPLFHPSLNNGGDLVFPGIIPANIGPGAPIGLGVGIFAATKQGQITKVVRPGDPAPGGSVFDFAQNPFINATARH